MKNIFLDLEQMPEDLSLNPKLKKKTVKVAGYVLVGKPTKPSFSKKAIKKLVKEMT